MKKLFLLFIYSFFLLSQLLSHGSVWRINHKGSTIFIGGINQLLRPEDSLPEEYEFAFEASGVLVLETDIHQAQNPELGTEIIRKMRYSDGNTLRSVLNEESYIALQEKLSQYPIPMNELEYYKPEMSILTIKAIDIQKLGIAGETMDIYFFEKAKQTGKRIEFFETIDNQLNNLSKQSEGHESEYVLFSLYELRNIENDLPLFISSWEDGSATFITSHIVEMQNQYAGLYRIYADKNKESMVKIENYLKEGRETEFILMDDICLYGPDGLLALLEEKGYTVKRVKMAEEKRKLRIF